MFTRSRRSFTPLPSTRWYSARVPSRDASHVRAIADLKQRVTQSPQSNVEVSGWVRSVRKASAVRFVDITDGSSMRPLQAVIEKSLATDLRPGTAVHLSGTWKNPQVRPDESAKASELAVESVHVLGASDPLTYPIQNKYQTPESLRSAPHLRMRTPLNSTLLRFRSDALFLLTQFFHQEGYQQTHPPIITSSDCEGAGEAFSVKAGKTSDEFFRDPKYLTVSSQLHLEALAQALGNVWTLSPTFRAEQSDTARHLSEFYMLEAEMSFLQDMQQVMGLLQQMLSSLVAGLRPLAAASELFNNRTDAKDPAERLAYEDLESLEVLQRRWKGLERTQPWPQITYTEAIEKLQLVKDKFEHEPSWGAGLQSEHERYLAETIGYNSEADACTPIFVTHYPRGIKAFYMPVSRQSPPDGQTVDCFDLLVPQLGELAGGSMREHRLAELKENMKRHGLGVSEGKDASSGGNNMNKTNSMDWYLDLRRWGCPPHGGFGLGFDRLLSYLTGVHNVRDVVPFPRHHQRCDC